MAKTVSDRFNMLMAAGGVIVGMFVIPVISDKFFPDPAIEQTTTQSAAPAHKPK